MTDSMKKLKSKKRIVIVVVICILLVAILAIVHNMTRIKVPKNYISIECEGAQYFFDINTTDTIEISGQVENQKNETKMIHGNGIALKDVVSQYCNDYNEITVIADDEYAARLDEAEIKGECEAYLLLEDGEARLYVFSDEKSKRNVANVKRIVIK